PKMVTTRALVVDDSTAYRRIIGQAMSDIPGVEVVGFAINGREAIEFLKRNRVDIMTLDMEMPLLDGLGTLAELRQLPTRPRVLMFSSLTREGAQATLQAMALGADDFLCKPNLSEVQASHIAPKEMLRGLLAPKLLQFFAPHPERLAAAGQAAGAAPAAPRQVADLSLFRARAVVIASSTGGPAALEGLLSKLPARPPVPMFIVQHMPPLFTASLSARLTQQCNVEAQEATHGLLAGPKVYIAPGDFHMRVILDGNKRAIMALSQEPKRNYVRPAADYLFESAVQVYGRQLLGVVLTGMGNDGCAGAGAVKRAGGAVIIQDKKSCVVYGMPKAVEDAGTFDRQGTLADLAALISHCTRL
ncbi:MAG: chemotaxis-specific protein-glutamate methyltransferase CheB, partial [Deltaproteobacteria bacterium]